MSIVIINPSVPPTPQALITEIQTFMAGKHSVTGAQLVAGVPTLQGMPRNEQQQAVTDAGMTFEED